MCKNLKHEIEKDLISVIIPVWKPNISYLKECVDSVIEQTYAKLEIILVYKKDQEFDEEFFKLMNTYEDNRLKILTSSGGVSKARNTGIINSKGEFVAHIDGDDFCEKQRFEKQLKFKKEKDCNVVGTWALNISKEGKVISKIQYPTTHNEIRKKIMLHDLILNPTVLMDRKMLDDVGLFDTTLSGSEDYDLWLRSLSRGYRFGNLPEYLVQIRENPQSITRGSGWRKHRVTSMKVRNKAVFQYGFSSPYDVFYYLLTPLSYFISPGLLMKLKKKVGWYQS